MKNTQTGRQATVEGGHSSPSPGWVLLAMVGLTFASLLVNIYLIGIPDPSDQVKTLIDTLNLTWKCGVFAVAGLLVGKGIFRHWPMGQ
jgi:uncharacterized membrane protein